VLFSVHAQCVNRYVGNSGPFPVAHRGGAGLAPENSIAAFSRAQALGFRYLETDIQITADGVCVAFHDRTLKRVLAVPGTVCGTRWSDLRALRFQGESVPTLDDLLDRFPDASFMMDVKDPAALDPMITVLRRHQALDRVCLAGASDRVLAAARERAGPQLCTSLGLESVIRLAVAARTGARFVGRIGQAEFVHVPIRCGPLPVYSERLVAMAHDLGLQVMVWTINDAAMIAGLLDAGVDGVITDRPDVLREVLIARDAWVAPGRTTNQCGRPDPGGRPDDRTGVSGPDAERSVLDGLLGSGPGQ
jgi:glycerophosphoryl diester phosphodiesterase